LTHSEKIEQEQADFAKIDEVKYVEDVKLSKLDSLQILNLKLFKEKHFLNATPTRNAAIYNNFLFIGDKEGFINVFNMIRLSKTKFQVGDKKEV
jgi:hypothetical protein